MRAPCESAVGRDALGAEFGGAPGRRTLLDHCGKVAQLVRARHS